MPLTLFSKTFGSYAYNDFLTSWEETLGYRHRNNKQLDIDGAFSAGTLQDPRRITMTGWVVAPDGSNTTFRGLWDSFKAAHRAGPPRQLFLDSDRYINAEVESLVFPAWKGMPNIQWEATMLCFDPFWYNAAGSTQALNTGANAFAVGGNVETLPVFTFVVASAGTITVTNAFGDIFIISPTAAGTYVVDSTQESLTLAGADSMAVFQSGSFINLGYMDGTGTFQGNETITVTLSGGATLTSASVAWHSRWD